MKADKTFFIDFTNPEFNYFHNGILRTVVEDFLKSNPDLLLDKIITKSDLTEVILEVLANNLTNVKSLFVIILSNNKSGLLFK